jgi:hypothetical protein
VFDLTWVPASGPSAVEQSLADRVRTHGRAAPAAAGAGRERLLAEGAAALSIAEFEQRRIDAALARRTRALAAFARWRPAAALDRQPGEVGAASAETRAACLPCWRRSASGRSTRCRSPCR